MPNIPWSKRTIYQLTLIGTAHGCQIVNVHTFEASAAKEGTTTSDQVAVTYAAELADEWIANLKTPWLEMHGFDYTLNMVRCQVLERPATWRHKLSPVERPLTSANIGGQSTEAESTTVSGVIKWRTPQAGKSYRGRTYVGPVPNTWVTNGRLGGTGPTVYGAYVTAMLAPYGSAGTPALEFALTVYSRPYNQGEYQYATRKTGTLTVVTPGDYGGNSTNVTAGAVDTILRSQRRREVGVGA